MRRKLIDIAYEYGRGMQSEHTGFLHFDDFIPIYDNLLFAQLLLQTKTVDHALEAIAVVEKLLAFQTVSGFFPRNIHEYPNPAGINHQVTIYNLLKRFAPRFEKATSRLKKAIETAEEPIHPSMEYLLAPNADYIPETIREWNEYLTSQAIYHIPPWNRALMIPAVAAEIEEWEESRPKVEFVDLYMATLLSQLPQRMQKGTREHLYAAFLPENPGENLGADSSSPWVGSTYYFGTADDLYPLTIESSGNIVFEDDLLSFPLSDEEHPRDQDVVELRLFFPLKNAQVLVNGKKQNTFAFSDKLSFECPYGTILLQYSIEEGNGDFMGHITRYNRPGQKIAKKSFDVFDYCITIRSLRRSSKAVVSAQFSVGLSEASPIA